MNVLTNCDGVVPGMVQEVIPQQIIGQDSKFRRYDLWRKPDRSSGLVSNSYNGYVTRHHHCHLD